MKQNITKKIFENASLLNPKNEVSSALGSYVSDSSLQIAEHCKDKFANLLPANSLAFKIITSNTSFFTEKQLWVITYELLKNEAYVSEVSQATDFESKKIAFAKNEQKEKLAANKNNSKDVLDFVKNSGQKLANYYDFVKKNKKFSKEFYSKNFSKESADAFIIFSKIMVF